MYTHLVANMDVESIVVDSEVDTILQEWSREVKRWKRRLRYINDVVIRDFGTLLECEQLEIVGRASHTLEALEDT
jgi:hypothetical protein